MAVREETVFDFGAARFDLEHDRAALAWLASHLAFGSLVATRAARDGDAGDHPSHVKVYGRIISLIGAEPQAIEPSARAWGTLASRAGDVCGVAASWMVSGVASLSAAVPDSLPRTLLAAVALQQQRGARADEVFDGDEARRRLIAGLSLASASAAARAAEAGVSAFPDHPVLARLPELARAVSDRHSAQLRREGVIHDSLDAFSPMERALLIAEAAARTGLRALSLR